MGRIQSVPGYKPLWQPSRWESCRDAGSAQAASPVPVPPQEAVSSFSPGSSSAHRGFLGEGRLYQVQCPIARPQALSALLPLSPLNGPGLHSLFLWLKGRDRREGPSLLLSPSTMAQAGWLNSFRLKPLILNLLRLPGGVLCVWWERFPGLGALGCLSLPLSPVPIHKPGQAHTVTEFAAAAVVGAIRPRPTGRGGERRCNQCCATPALPGHLLGVSSPAGWHGPGDYE